MRREKRKRKVRTESTRSGSTPRVESGKWRGQWRKRGGAGRSSKRRRTGPNGRKYFAT